MENTYPKFYALEEAKQARIVNAAMKEFCHGYNQAKTDNITQAAGISKGLLFHYFGTKENLYDFLIAYAVATIQAEYVDKINTHQADILESVWQMSLLKQDLAQHFPALFDFLTATYMDTRHSLNPAQKARLVTFQAMRNKVLAEMLAACDKTLFREDVDPRKALEIIEWTLAGCAEGMAARAAAAAADGSVSYADLGEEARNNYTLYLTEFKSYLDIFRRCFYRNK